MSEQESLYDKCENIYTLAGRVGVFDFINRFHPFDVEWGICVPCESESPYDLDDPNTCLACGSSERDDREVTA